MAVINTNVKALFSQMALKSSGLEQSKAMQQLSTGKRINSARDDAAGMSIATRMTHQIRSLNQAVRNAGDAINLIQTAEGATNEITDMMQRMRELAVQAVNDTNSNEDRSYLDLEFQQLKQQIVQISDNTEWNGFSVLNGKAGQQVGEMPVYKVTSDNQFGSVFIQPTTTKSITGTDVGEIQSFSLTGATPTTGVMNIAGVDVPITPTENTIAAAADKITRTLNNSTEFSSQGMTASYVVPTKEAVTATPSATETNTVTFQDLTVGQSVSFGGLKIAATGALTASDIATAFYTGRAPANGLLTGTLTGFSAGVPNIGVVKFTSTNVGSNITDVTPASSGLVAAPATPASTFVIGAGAGFSKLDVTFGALSTGQSVSVGTVKFTAVTDVTAAQVASYFAGMTTGVTPSNPTTGVFSGAAIAFNGSSTAGSASVSFTASVAGATANPTVAAAGTAAATAATVAKVDGASATKVTFTDMAAGQTVTVDGRIFTASAAVTGVQVASYFGGAAPGANGAFTGALAGTTTAGAATAGSASLVFTSTAADKTGTDLAVSNNYVNFEVKYSAAQGDVSLAKVLSGSTSMAVSNLTTTRKAITQAAEVFANNGKFLQSGAISLSVPSGTTAGSAITASFVTADSKTILLSGVLDKTNPATIKFEQSAGLNSSVISTDLTYELRDSEGGSVDLVTTPRAVAMSVGVEGSIPSLRDGDLLINGVNVGPSLAQDDVLSPRNNAIGSAIAKAAAINRVAVDQGISQGQIQSIVFSGTSMPGTITVGGVSVALTSDDNTPTLAAAKIAAAMKASPLYDSSTSRTITYAPGSATLSVNFPPSEGIAAKLDVQPGVTGLGSVVNTTQQYATKVPGTGVFAKVNENILSGQAMTGGPVATGVVFINGFASANITTVYNNSQATRDNVVRAINLISDKTGVKAIDSGSDEKGVSLVAADGRNIEVQFEPSGTTNSVVFGQRIGMREGVQGATISLESKIQAPVVLSSAATGDINRSGLVSGNYSKNESVLNTKARAPVVASVAQVNSVKVTGTANLTDTFSVVVNGTTFTTNATDAGGTSPQNLTDKMISLINEKSTLGVFASKGTVTGEILLQARTPGVAFTMTSSASAGAGVGVVATDVTANGPAAFKNLGMSDLEINGIAIRPTSPLDDEFSISSVSSSDPGSSAIALAAAINDSVSLTGVKAFANPASINGSITSTETPISGKQSLYVNGIQIDVDFVQNESGTDRRNKVVAAINERTGQHGVVATDNGKGVSLSTDGRNLSVWFDSSKDELAASDFGLDKGGSVAQVSKIKVAGNDTTGGKSSVMINGVKVETDFLATPSTPDSTATALAVAINKTDALKNITAVASNDGSGTVLITSNVAGTAFDLRAPAVTNLSAQTLTLSTVTANSQGANDVSAVDMSEAYLKNVLGSATAPLSAMNIKTVYGTVRMVSDAPVLPALPGADGLPPTSMNVLGKPIQIRAGSDGVGAMSNFMDLGFNEGSFGGRASVDMEPPRVGRMAFQVGSSANQVITIDLADFGKKGPITGEITGDVDLLVEQRTVRINTRDGATAVLNLLDESMNKVNATRATMGAVMNRLDHVINNLTNVSMNMSASRSSIEDADYASASTELAKTQIMQQAATAVLAQANTSQQSVMKLLGG
jgi:flagellin